MVQVALASILEKLNNEQKIKNLEEFGISQELLNKVKSKLGFMQQLINKQKENLGSKNKIKDLENSLKTDGDKTKDSKKTANKLDNSKLKRIAEMLDLSEDELTNKLNNLNKKEIKNLKQTIKLENTELKKIAQILDLPESKLQNLRNNLSNEEIKYLKKFTNLNNSEQLNNVESKGVTKATDSNNQSKADKIYHQTLKKQANAENNKTKQVSLGLKDKGKNLAASQLNSELKANLDFKELNKNSDLKKLLTKENFNTAENKIKTSTNNTKQNSSFSNLFSGNQQQSNFAQLFGTQNLSGSNNVSSGENTPQFSSSVLKGAELAKQVTDQIKVLNKPANNEINIQLEPDFLGKVKMNLKVDGGKVTARFMVDNILVKNHLDQNISQLKSTLINQGFNVDNLEVNAEDSGYDMGREDGSNQFFQGENKKQNQRQFNYNEYEKLKDELLDLSPEQLEKIVENDPEKLRNWGYVQQNDWFSYGGHYQRMNLLA